ncbi:hypothetical protein BS47DRAFT_1340619 [Hydnum rufescens UP504]|uniref:Uncharacterized protein n=1 Tax=Hydnum rufescens UP504 TaxID=1448309 RepID=A0A9P6DWS6_9AGAM|nr:hypothetical protein BS47DRAFT_1340619 [Hydnum rufescens UP504]
MTPPPPAYPSPSLESLINPAASASIASDHSYPPPPPIRSPPLETVTLNSLHQGFSPPDAIPPSGRSSSTSTLSTTSCSPPPPFGASQSHTQSHPVPLTTASPQVHSELTRFLLAPAPPPKSNRLSFLPSAVSSSLMGRHKSFVIRTRSIPPVLTFTDTTSLLIGSGVASGIIELDHGVARALGVEPSWWIAVALAYVEFLDERDAYLAAANG